MHGGRCEAVEEQLKNVQQIQASSGDFVAVLADGSTAQCREVTDYQYHLGGCLL